MWFVSLAAVSVFTDMVKPPVVNSDIDAEIAIIVFNNITVTMRMNRVLQRRL
jgi:hypothetical protein